MTLTEIEEAARAQYNGDGDTFFNSVDFYRSIYQASQILAREALCIEAAYTTTTVASTQEYAFPSNTISIKRVTYDGRKVECINMRQDDMLTLQGTGAVSTGTPQYYFVWDDTIYLRPVPAEAATLKIFSYNEASEIVAGSSIEIPTLFHMDMVEYVLSRMYAKDKDSQMAAFHRDLWDRAVGNAKRWAQKRKRGDSMPVVNSEEGQAVSYIGAI